MLRVLFANQALLSAFQSLQQQISTMTTNLGTKGSNRGDHPESCGKGPNYCPQHNISKYCWSHGACAHPSAECKAKRPGHIDSATFENKQGGSTAYCGNCK